MNITPPKSQSPDLINFYGRTAYGKPELVRVPAKTNMLDVLRMFRARLYITCVSQGGAVYRYTGGGQWNGRVQS